MDERFCNRLNLIGLVFLVSKIRWMDVPHGACNSDLPLPLLNFLRELE